MTDTYHVLLPIGSEGPYSCDELRNRLASGKVRSSDRVMHAETRAVSVLTDIIPEAGEASKARAPVSERIRRSNSDRHVAVQRSSERLQAVAPAITPGLSTPPVATPPVHTPTPEEAKPEAKTPRSPAVALVVLIVAFLALAWMWWPSAVGGAHDLRVGDLSGMWKSLPNTTGGQVEIDLQVDRDALTFTDSKGVRRAQVTIMVASPDALVVRLKPADPQFGEALQINRSPYGMTFCRMRGPNHSEDSLLMVKMAPQKPTAAPLDLGSGPR